MNNYLYNDGIDYKGKEYQKETPLDWQLKRYANKKFGKLLVECPVWVKGLVTVPSTTQAIWLTHCDCGNDYCISMQWIRKELKKGLIPDCGCGARAEQDSKYIGKTYNWLTVLERDDEYKKQGHFADTNTYYKCQCKCGKIIHVRINTLTHGDVKSCGCMKEEQDKINLIPKAMKDLTGQRFGKLVALYPFKNSNSTKNEFWWHCQCDCGKTHDVRGISLTRGDTQSCGCMSQSHGEFAIEALLRDNNIDYLFDVEYFKDLVLPSGGIGRYDFILFDDNHKPYRLIEYDGQQHYVAKDYFGGEKGLKMRQENDKAKDNYAITHNLPLVRIPYDVKDITLDTILSDKYLVNNIQ